MRSRSSSSLVLALLLLMARPAASREGDAFREHYQRAASLYQSARYEGAIHELEAAYALQPHPRLLINLGQAYRKLGRPRDALRHYERYLREGPERETDTRARVEAYIAEARAQIDAEARQARSDLDTPPAPNIQPIQLLPRLAPGTTGSAGRRPARPPLYQRWWFWTTIGVVTAGAVAGIVGATLPAAPEPPNPIDLAF